MNSRLPKIETHQSGLCRSLESVFNQPSSDVAGDFNPRRGAERNEASPRQLPQRRKRAETNSLTRPAVRAGRRATQRRSPLRRVLSKTLKTNTHCGTARASNAQATLKTRPIRGLPLRFLPVLSEVSFTRGFFHQARRFDRRADSAEKRHKKKRTSALNEFEAISARNPPRWVMLLRSSRFSTDSHLT